MTGRLEILVRLRGDSPIVGNWYLGHVNVTKGNTGNRSDGSYRDLFVPCILEHWELGIAQV